MVAVGGLGAQRRHVDQTFRCVECELDESGSATAIVAAYEGLYVPRSAPAPVRSSGYRMPLRGPLMS